MKYTCRRVVGIGRRRNTILKLFMTKPGKTMYSVDLLDTFKIEGVGTVLLIASPVSADRNNKSMHKAIGSNIKIGDQIYKPKGFDMHRPLTPVNIGEIIGIVVQEIKY